MQSASSFAEQTGALAIVLDGIRIPTLGNPAETTSEISEFLGTMTVSGPGANAANSASAASEM